MAKKRAKKVKKPEIPPQCKAILLCDSSILDFHTRKISLIGLFSRFYVPGFPGKTTQFRVYLQLVNGDGSYDIRVELVQMSSNNVIAQSQPIKIVFPNKLETVSVVLNIPELTLEESGKYEVNVFSNDIIVDRQTFDAVDSSGDSSEQQNNPTNSPD